MNKLTTILLAFALFAMSEAYAQTIQMANIEQSAKTEFYAHLMFQETPYSPYVGIHPIDEDTAKQRLHYRFSYDDKARLSKIQIFNGTKPSAYYGSFDTYYWFGSGVEVEYQENSEIHYFLDANGTRIESPYIPHYGRYTFNNNGIRSTLGYFSKSNEPMNNRFGAHRFQWKVEEDGLIAEKRYNLENNLIILRPDVEFYETRFKFDEHGKVEFMYNYGLDGKIANNSSGAAIDRIFYDLEGNFIRWQVYDKNGLAVEGNGPNVHTGEYLYNDVGDKLAVRFFDRSGYPMESSDGLHHAANHYDDSGRFAKETQYDINGNIIQVHQRQFASNHTRVVWDRFFDGQNQPKINPYFGGAAAVNYIYDNQGNLKERRHYDQKLEFFDPFG